MSGAANGVLWGFFSRNLDEVAAAISALPDGSSGEVTSAEAPFRLGSGRRHLPWGSLYAQAIFGPTRELCCACGATEGGAQAGEVCPWCGTVCGSVELRNRRWGHIVVPPVVHPAVLARLGVSEDAVASSSLGPEELRALLGAGPAVPPSLLGVKHIPVPPPGARPFVEGLTPSMVDPWVGPLNERWAGLVRTARIGCALRERGAPAVVIEAAEREVQARVVDVWASTIEPDRLPEVPHERPLDEGALRLRLPGNAAEPSTTTPPTTTRLAFLEDGALAVQRNGSVRILGPDQLERSCHPAEGELLGTRRGSLVFRHRQAMSLPDDTLPLSLLEPESGYREWATPGALPPSYVAKEQPEELSLVPSRGRASSIVAGADRPDVMGYAPGLDAVWLGEVSAPTVVFDLEIGVPLCAPPEPQFDALAEVDLDLRIDPPGELEEEVDGGATACCFSPEHGWRFLWPDGRVNDHLGTVLLRLAPVVCAAAFSFDGDRLACIPEEADELVVVDLVRRDVETRRRL